MTAGNNQNQGSAQGDDVTITAIAMDTEILYGLCGKLLCLARLAPHMTGEDNRQGFKDIAEELAQVFRLDADRAVRMAKQIMGECSRKAAARYN